MAEERREEIVQDECLAAYLDKKIAHICANESVK